MGWTSVVVGGDGDPCSLLVWGWMMVGWAFYFFYFFFFLVGWLVGWLGHLGELLFGIN